MNTFFAAYIRSNQIMGWGEKAIEIRSVETGHLDGVFMHKRAQRLKFLCERNDKVRSLSRHPAADSDENHLLYCSYINPYVRCKVLHDYVLVVFAIY